MIRALVVAALVAGCGGGGGAPAPAAPSQGATSEEAVMVPPEAIDEIERRLDRKRNVVSRCLATAVDNKELPRNARGKVTVEIVIAPNGRADDVRVTRSTLESRSLTDCVVGHIKDIQFPELPRPFPTSYTYGFEAT